VENSSKPKPFSELIGREYPICNAIREFAEWKDCLLIIPEEIKDTLKQEIYDG
jgi:hypothetical protein